MERRWHATDRNATLAIDIIRRCAPASRISSCPQAPAPTLITHRTAQHSTGPSACSSSSSTTSAPCPRRVQTQSTKAAEELHIAAGDHSSRDQHYSRYLSRCHAAHATRKSPARNTKSSWSQLGRRAALSTSRVVGARRSAPGWSLAPGRRNAIVRK